MSDFLILDFEPYADAAGNAARFALYLRDVGFYPDVLYSQGWKRHPGVFYLEENGLKSHFSRALNRKITRAIQALLAANAPASPFYFVEAEFSRGACRILGLRELTVLEQPVQLDFLSPDNTVDFAARVRRRG